MRIAIVVNTSWNIYNFRLGLVKSLLEAGHDVIAIAPRDEYSKYLEGIGCQYREIKIANKGTNPIRDFFLIKDLYKIYMDLKPGIILHYTIKPNIYGAIASKMANIPCINTVTGLGTVFLHTGLSSTIAKVLYRFSFRFPKHIFFQNQDDLILFKEEGLIKSMNVSVLAGSGVDTDKFKPVLNKTKGIPFTFLMVGRLLFDKGIIEFIEAIKYVKANSQIPMKFQLIGAIDASSNLGVSKEVVDDWIKFGLIDYLGFTDNIVLHYQNADCVVLPSYREGTPKSLLEAGACGVPIIATNVPGCKDVVIENYNGYLCQVKNFIDLGNAMLKMANIDKVQFEFFSKNARNHILNKFDEKIVINEYFEAISNS